MSNRRTVMMVLTSVLAAGSVIWMQRKFEGADQRNALAVVQGYRPKRASIPEVIALRHPGRPIEWTTATESACFQHVRVHAVVEEPGREPELFAFTVDINGPSIHPANEAGKAVLGELDTAVPPPPPAAGSAASDTAAATASAAPAPPPAYPSSAEPDVRGR